MSRLGLLEGMVALAEASGACSLTRLGDADTSTLKVRVVRIADGRPEGYAKVVIGRPLFGSYEDANGWVFHLDTDAHVADENGVVRVPVPPNAWIQGQAFDPTGDDDGPVGHFSVFPLPPG